jgi:hypothetical protein
MSIMSCTFAEACLVAVVVICFSATFLCACACCLSGRISREQGDSE